MTHVIVSGEKGGSVMYGEGDERGKSTVWQGDGARLLAVLLCLSGKVQRKHTSMYTHITIHITHSLFSVMELKSTSRIFLLVFNQFYNA